MKKARVLKPFGYSVDGLHITEYKPGDVGEFFDAIADGLIQEGHIKIIDGSSPQPPVIETKVGDGELHVKHIGRGKYAVYRGSERLTHDPLEKDEAESALAEMVGAT